MQHAKKRPPSSASRWLSCPASVSVMPLYPDNEKDPNVRLSALRGEQAHKLLEDADLLGRVPEYHDQDIVDAVEVAYEYLLKCREHYKEKGEYEEHTEVRLEIVETGEFGTADRVFVTPNTIHVIDFKNGYVPVGRKSPQLILYLMGAIARFGERKHYKITVIQPNYDHADGLIRSDDIDDDMLEFVRREIQYSILHENEFGAGKHCKTSYCPHRGSCATFLAWAPEHLPLAYHPGDVNSMDDAALSEAIDQADILQGWRDLLRGEAMRRMLNMDRVVPGKKLVKSKQVRDFLDDAARERAFKKAMDVGATEEALYKKEPVSVKGLEDFYKAQFRKFGPGKYKPVFDEAMEGNLKSSTSGLTVVNDSDGRPAYRRGGEFGALVGPANGMPNII